MLVKAQPVCTPVPNQAPEMEFGVKQKRIALFVLPGKERPTMLLPQKIMCVKPRILNEGFYDGGSKMGSLTRTGCKQGFHLLDLIPGDQSANLDELLWSF